jgi:SAM-dependent methyltransferase
MTGKDVRRPDYWQGNYDAGRLPWDLGGPTPVFQRLAENSMFLPGRMLVLGAGTGHDARLFSRHGFVVTAVDFAPGAVAAMQALADPTAPVDIRQADLFDLPDEFTAAFDYVLEYVCFCAIDPGQREAYSRAVDGVLRPGGLVIALAFPMFSGPGGPPFAVNPDEFAGLFLRQGYHVVHREMPPDSIRPRRANEELIVLQKPG